MNVVESVKLALPVIEALEAEDVPYMVVGGISSSYWGIPRATKDADIVIKVESSAKINALEARLAGKIKFDPQITFETITGNVRHILRCKGSPFLVELFELSADPHNQQRFARRMVQFVSVLDRKVILPSAEDVIIQKLRWGRSKDLDDARDVMAVQDEALDWSYIEDWCAKHGTLQRMKTVRDSIPPI